MKRTVYALLAIYVFIAMAACGQGRPDSAGPQESQAISEESVPQEISEPETSEPELVYFDEPNGGPDDYPKQAKRFLLQCMDGSALRCINRAKDEGQAIFPGMNYSDARMSPNGNYILCKTNAGGAGEARWSGYAVLDLTTHPTETYAFNGEQWGYQDHIFLSDDLIGFASGGVIGGQEDTWKPIQLFDNKYNPLDTKLAFSGGEDTQIAGIAFDSSEKRYALACAKNTAGGEEIPFSSNRLVLALFGQDGAFIGEREFPEEYMSPYSPNVLALLPNNPAVAAESRILIRAIKREDDYSSYKLLVVNTADWSVRELPYGEAVRLSANGDRAFAISYDEQGLPSPVILRFEGRAEPAVETIPDTVWEVEGYSGRFYPIDAVMRDRHTYVMAENYTGSGDTFSGLFYWDGERAELLQVFPGRDYCSLAGVDGEGFCHIMLHGICGDEYADQRAYAETITGPVS